MGKMFYWRESFGTMGEAVTGDWWLVTSDWETSDSRIVISSEARNLCHPRSDGRCLEIRNGKPAMQETFGHRHHLYSAALLFFMRRTTPVEPSEPAEPLSHAIEGRHAQGANPEPFHHTYSKNTKETIACIFF